GNTGANRLRRSNLTGRDVIRPYAVFALPLSGARYLVYAPLRGVAFVANSTLVDGIARHAADWVTALLEAGTAGPSSSRPSDALFAGCVEECVDLRIGEG